jgi:redox-sensitive bicupin YhaK (pirin superfamily)
MVAPHFTMLWAPTIPKHQSRDAEGRLTTVTLKAGALGKHKPPAPPPNSWAAKPEADVAIWNIEMAPGAHFTLPPAKAGTDRTLYLYRGEGEVRVSGRAVQARHQVALRGDREVSLRNGKAKVELLLLQGRPIGEPVARGGWPWDRSDPVHARTEGRFALHADGRVERPT